MDDDTRAALARFERRMANVQRLDRRAEILSERADALQQQLDEKPTGLSVQEEAPDPVHIAELRTEAAALSAQADGIQGRLYKPPSTEMQKQVEVWAARRLSLDDNDFEHEP